MASCVKQVLHRLETISKAPVLSMQSLHLSLVVQLDEHVFTPSVNGTCLPRFAKSALLQGTVGEIRIPILCCIRNKNILMFEYCNQYNKEQ